MSQNARRPAPRREKKPAQGLLETEHLRLLIFGGIILLVFLIMIVKLGYIQTRAVDKSKEAISRQSLRRIRIPATRGKIYTRDLTLLAGGSSDSNLVIYPQEMQVKGSQGKTVSAIFDAAETISKALRRTNPLTKEDITRHLNLQPGLPLVLFRQLTQPEIARALESGRSLKGVGLESDESRTYPEGKLAAHIIGYTRLQDPQSASDRRDFSYYVPDRIGVEGIERAFDLLPGSDEDDEARPPGLRGLPGYSLVQVDHLGFIQNKLISKIEPRHGNNVILTIDSRAQRIAESVIAGKRAAIVVLDAANGDVLASASSPSYDLSAGFTPFIRADYYRKLLADPDRPLYNRALLGNYTPGSILKPLVALAFLNSGVSPAEIVNCDGYTQIGNARVRCAARNGHGPLNLEGALAKSCNDYMIEHALKTGLNPIAEVLRSAGIGRRTGIELPELAGTFPSDAEKRKRQKMRWTNYDTGLLSIGQGIITLTPLQGAVYAAALANGGTVWKPHVVYRVVDSNRSPLYERKAEPVGELQAGRSALDVVRRGMFDVVNTPRGSGREAKVEGLDLYGKTGSAEVGPLSSRFLTTWFIAFVTYRGRTYSCCVMVEEGKSGGRSCAPLAAEFFRRYLLETPRST